jgi:hypothetical protein
MTTYHVSRHGRPLGVYSEDEAREYYAQGRIAPDDLLWREGMASGVPASQVFGSPAQASSPGEAPLPPPLVPDPAPAPSRTVRANQASVPLPPKLHWALVLAFTVVTLGLFYVVWMFVQAAWVKRIDPGSNATPLLTIYVVLTLIGQVMIEASDEGSGAAAVGLLLVLAGTVVSIFGFFSMRRSMLDYYDKTEPIGLRLSAALTFFLSVFYLQYHMTRIVKWRQTGILPL